MPDSVMSDLGLHCLPIILLRGGGGGGRGRFPSKMGLTGTQYDKETVKQGHNMTSK